MDNEATIDAFLYDKERQIGIMLQSTMTQESHSVKMRGIEKLKARGGLACASRRLHLRCGDASVGHYSGLPLSTID